VIHQTAKVPMRDSGFIVHRYLGSIVWYMQVQNTWFTAQTAFSCVLGGGKGSGVTPVAVSF